MTRRDVRATPDFFLLLDRDSKNGQAGQGAVLLQVHGFVGAQGSAVKPTVVQSPVFAPES